MLNPLLRIDLAYAFAKVKSSENRLARLTLVSAVRC